MEIDSSRHFGNSVLLAFPRCLTVVLDAELLLGLRFSRRFSAGCERQRDYRSAMNVQPAAFDDVSARSTTDAQMSRAVRRTGTSAGFRHDAVPHDAVVFRFISDCCHIGILLFELLLPFNLGKVPLTDSATDSDVQLR
jgi:hypothetical protein